MDEIEEEEGGKHKHMLSPPTGCQKSTSCKEKGVVGSSQFKEPGHGRGFYKRGRGVRPFLGDYPDVLHAESRGHLFFFSEGTICNPGGGRCMSMKYASKKKN